ncbi:MAG TPA: DivIVA domain-containing protein [Pseudonocardiaceae bacterium]|nr:DivIVA domain-containing protein [Pseudonocardiaceae bacterium]
MPLLPDEVAAKSFRRRWGRGYDRNQVEAFLRDVASDYGAAISRVAVLADERTAALAGNSSLRNEIDALARSVRDVVESGRAEAERDAKIIYVRAAQAAASITHQAEQSAAALTRHAESLRSAAQSDADAARQRWDALRVETTQRWDRLRAAERRMDQCIQQTDRALRALRARVVLLDQVDEVEQLIAAIRTDVQDVCTELHTPTNGAGETTL